MKELNIEKLDEIFEYDFKEGIIYWKDSGDVAGGLNNLGYIQVKIEGVHYLVHRILWAAYYGYWPSETLDHIDRVPSNNSISNLREASVRENAYNKELPTNKTGYRGVTYRNPNYQAAIRVEAGTLQNLGRFSTAEEASIVVESRAREIHGSFYKDPGYTYDKSIIPMPILANTSSTGYVGVNKKGSKFQAKISIKGKRVSLGVYTTAEEASIAYQEAKLERDANK